VSLLTRICGPRIAIALPVSLVLSTLTACGDSGPSPTSREGLDNATFLTQATETGTIDLVEGSAVVPADGVEFTLLTSAEGDLDLDDEIDAAAIVVEKRGQNHFLHLHAVLRDGDAATDVSARMIGDRLGVRRIKIEEGIIRVDLLIREPGQPATVQPSVDVSQHFALVGRGIIPIVQTQVSAAIEPTTDTRSSSEPPALYTHEWQLSSFEMPDWTGDLGIVDPIPSLRLVADLADVAGASGKLSGYAGCNRIFGSFRAEDMTSLLISGVAATRRACSSDRMDFERRFVAAITAVDTYEVVENTLILDFTGGTLRFQAGGRLLPSDSSSDNRGVRGEAGSAERPGAEEPREDRAERQS